MIDHYSFGHMILNKMSYYKDLIVQSGEVLPDWRREKGHFLQLCDLELVLNQYTPQSVVVGTGSMGVMKISDEVNGYFKVRNIPFHVHPTGKAVKVYNRLLGVHADVLGCFHLTC